MLYSIESPSEELLKILHASEEDSGTRLIAHQNMEFSHIDINLEFWIGIRLISYTSPIGSPLYPLCFGNVDIASAPLVVSSRAETWKSSCCITKKCLLGSVVRGNLKSISLGVSETVKFATRHARTEISQRLVV